MSGCGMRNGEAAAVNNGNAAADDVYRIGEQVNQATGGYGRLKHRKEGEYRDVPLPAWGARASRSTRPGTARWTAICCGTRRTRRSRSRYHYLSKQWRRLKSRGEV
jgi:hypothetical protein